MLICAMAAVAVVVSRYDMCFQDGEVLTGHMFDGGFQPRIVSYAGYVLTLESRLALWDYIPPHPSFSPVWILTVVAGPILLFRLLRLELGQAAARCGTAVYLVSVGHMSGMTMLFHTAKPLTNTLVIAVMYVAARLNRTVPAHGAHARDRRHWIVALMILLTLAPFTDHTAAFAFAVPLVLCPGLFWKRAAKDEVPTWRNWIVLVIPAIVAAAFMVFVLPDVFASLGRDFQPLAYMRSMSNGGVNFERLLPSSVIWQAGNLMSAALLPWQWTAQPVPISAGPDLSFTRLAVLAVVAAAATLAAKRARVNWQVYRRYAVLAILFVAFQCLVLVFHELSLVASGFYYGAIFSILFAALVATVIASCSQWTETRRRLPLRAAIVGMMAISLGNVVTINASWMAHSNAKTIEFLTLLANDRHGADVGALAAHEEQYHRRNAGMADGALPSHYIGDIRSGAHTRFQDVWATWTKWRRGDPQFLAGRPLDLRTLWLAVELDMKASHRPRRWKTFLSQSP